ncbi:MAG: B12-binding domain-containing radical SAM protein [Flavobacteriales bacterium]|nr:B12-binding domain-containing radical SAM protein [Flavobacteriales bacterium]
MQRCDRILLLNLPGKEQITRRYMCSYVSPESLLPPVELISMAAVAREWKGAHVLLVDSMAERLDEAAVRSRITAFAPDIIVSLSGFECYEEDMDTLRGLKSAFPNTLFLLFGHYATHFPKETLIHSATDYILLGEPELIFSDLLDAFKGQHDLKDVQGIVYRSGTEVLVQGTGTRIPDPNALPMPAYDLLPKGRRYYEPLMAEPFGMIQTARGCPYQCNYCVKSFGTKLTTLTPQRIVDEMKEWKRLFNVKSIRFIDDTFTITRARVIELCQLMIAEKLNLEWACLSRTDNLDAELLQWMRRSGCKRIYFGMESGSQRMLDIYRKQVNVDEARAALLLCREAGIETAAFFMSGHPEETEEDFELTVNFARSAKLNFASFNPLTLYPGTAIFREMNGKVNFSIYPYSNDWKDSSIYDDFTRRKKRFYRKFYMRPSFLLSSARLFLSSPASIAQMGIGLMRYLWWDSKFVISGLKGARDA